MRYVIEYTERESQHTHWQLSGNYEWMTTENRRGPRRINSINFPSLQAAQEEAQRQQSQSISNIYRARDTQPELATQGGDMPQPATPARAIRIYRRNKEWVVDVGGRPEPVISQLYPYLAMSARQSCRDRGDYSIKDALIHGASPQLLSSAISAYYVEHPNVGGAVAQEEGITEMPDANAYVAWGDFIYKMIPVRQASSSKAIRLMREKVRRDVESIRVNLTQQASQESQQVIAQANQRAAVIRAEAQAELNSVQSAHKFPAWTLGLPVYMDGDRRVFALRKVAISITGLAHGNLQWAAKSAPPIQVYLWLPLDGIPDHVRMFDVSQGCLPHITSSGACMKIGEKIEPITSLVALDKFVIQVARVHSTINLASLLNPEVSTWLPSAQAVLPDSVKAWLGRYTRLQDQRDCSIEHMPSGHTTARGDETWSVR